MTFLIDLLNDYSHVSVKYVGLRLFKAQKSSIDDRGSERVKGNISLDCINLYRHLASLNYKRKFFLLPLDGNRYRLKLVPKEMSLIGGKEIFS